MGIPVDVDVEASVDKCEASVDVEKYQGVVVEMSATVELEASTHASDMDKVFEKFWQSRLRTTLVGRR